ncbi:MAG: LysM peptidoglycan-binding domain-containing protein [Gemmatimonadetes bacterium]|nr:LysM peptidoglycan-binding domain-containing protein [Gemmatimonadota bacterium]
MLEPRVAPRLARGLVTVAVAGALVFLASARVTHAQVTEAIKRARQAEEQASQRNKAVDQQAQQATQEGKPGAKAPEKPAQGGAQNPQTGTQGGAQPAAPRRPAPMPRLTSGPTPGANAGGPGTHTVEKGETLWGIAQRYLSDPYLWPEIYRINKDVVEDPRWIYPGEVLKLPGATPPATVGAVAVATPGGQPAAVVQQEAPVQEAEPPEGSTVFSSFRRATSTASRNAFIQRPAPIVRSGEYASAPFVTAANGPAWSGRVLESLNGVSVDVDRKDRAIQLADPVSITPPSGAPPQVGTRYLVIRPGPTVPGVGAVVVPTGIVDVESIERGKAPVARVTKLFDAMRAGQGLIPYERVRVDSAARPVALANGPMTTVAYLLADPVLPTIQAFIVLGAKGITNPRVGDVFAMIRPATVGATGAPVPEEVIGTAQVVRVTPQALTAVLTGQNTGAIKVGTQARLAARMP